MKSMNRTIKFRAKSIHSNDWCYGSLVQTADNWEIQGFDIFGDGNSEWQEEVVEEDTIGQFTGLCDKSGKEIYEGDLVKYEYAYDIEFVAVIKYKDAQFVIMDSEDSCFWLSDSKKDEIEIIGNIHDNKGLIETNEE